MYHSYKPGFPISTTVAMLNPRPLAVNPPKSQCLPAILKYHNQNCDCTNSQKATQVTIHLFVQGIKLFIVLFSPGLVRRDMILSQSTINEALSFLSGWLASTAVSYNNQKGRLPAPFPGKYLPKIPPQVRIRSEPVEKP